MCVYAQYIVNTENIEIVQADRRIQADGTVEKRKHCADTGVYLLNSMFTSRARALSQLVARARACPCSIGREHGGRALTQCVER